MKPVTKHIVAYVLFFILSVAVMAPVIPRMATVMYGLPGDPYFTIWKIWNFKQAVVHNNPLYFSHYLGAPFGVDLRFVPYHLLWDKMLLAIALVSNEVFAYNLFIFLGFFLSGVTMYHLAFYITKERRASFFAALIYMFCPYHLARSVGHLTLANIQWLPLFILSILKFADRGTFKKAVFAGFMLGVVFISNYYYGMFSCLMLFILFFIMAWVKKIKVTRGFMLSVGIVLLIATCIIAVFIIPVYMNTLHPAANNVLLDSVYARSTEPLFTGSARPLSYLLPSYMHPVFGGFTLQRVGSLLYGDSRGENALYLGIFPLLLSWSAIRRKLPMARIFFYLLIASIVLSMPPYIKLFRIIIPLPQYIIFKITPIFRTFARFGIYAALCTSVLAALGLKELLEKRSQHKKIMIYVVAIAIVMFEFLINPFRYATDLNRPPEAYQWLAQQPGNFVISEYPMNQNELIRSDRLIWQRLHQKGTVDGAFPGSRAAPFKKHILRLQDRKTPRILRWLGVKYVLVHTEEMEKSETLDIVGVVPDFARHPGLSLVKKFDAVDVYEVTARPLQPEEP
jgi:hypothetical protein